MPMQQYNLRAVIDVPERGATPQQVREWILFRIGHTAQLSEDNPLVDEDLRATGRPEVEPY